MVYDSYIDTQGMSEGLTPASSNTQGPDQPAPGFNKSSRPVVVRLGDSPWPRILTLRRGRSRATSGLTSTTAPPPSVITHESRRCSGSATSGELTTSSMVTFFLSCAFGLYWA